MCKREENPELGYPSEPAGYRKLGERLGWKFSACLIILLQIYFEASAGWIGVWCLKNLKLSDRTQPHFGNEMVTLGKSKQKQNNWMLNTFLFTCFQPNPHYPPFRNCQLFLSPCPLQRSEHWNTVLLAEHCQELSCSAQMKAPDPLSIQTRVSIGDITSGTACN